VNGREGERERERNYLWNKLRRGKKDKRMMERQKNE
jgi:hypothetical protein